MKRYGLLLICAACGALACATIANAGIIFSNNFEDGDLTPEIGTWAFGPDSATTSVVGTSSAPDPTLGNNVGLIDQDTALTNPLDLTLNLTSTASLAGGNTVTIDFDVAARRTTGNSKTVFVDALDSNGDIVVRFVLGDANAFGNANNDRQRPGHDPTSTGNANTGNSTFGSPPGSFWFGADGNPVNGFDVVRDAHMALTIGASSFDFSTTRANGQVFSTTGVSNRDAGTYADIAEIKLTSVGTNYGIYLDNLVVVAIPEPLSATLLGLSGLVFLIRRNR